MDTVTMAQSAFSMGTFFTIYTIVVAIGRLGLGITLSVLAIKCMLKYLKSNEG